MTVKVNGNKVTIELEFDKKGRPSASGKTTVHASTNGNKESEVEVNGKKLIVGVNAYTSNKG